MDFNNNSFLGTLRILLLKGDKGDKGEAGVSGDYSSLTNKPKINNVTIDGNITGSDLGLASEVALETVDNKIDALQSDLFSVQQETVYTGSVSSGVIGSGVISKTGYTPIGIVGYDLSFGGGVVNASELVVGEENGEYRVYYNLQKISGTPSGEVSCRVLYMKNPE